MRTSTLLFPRELAERDLARVLEEQFGAAWFPDHHRCSIHTEDAFVAVNFDPQYTSRLEAEVLQFLGTALGFVPKTVLHIQPSSYLPGSGDLAEQVLQALS